jgi:hypothetical protein
MTEITIAYCSSHVPMMAAARVSAEEQQRTGFSERWRSFAMMPAGPGVQACVVLSKRRRTGFRRQPLRPYRRGAQDLRVEGHRGSQPDGLSSGTTKRLLPGDRV